MNHTRDITQDLQDWLHEPDRLPPPRISEVAPLVHRTPQQRGLVPPMRGRFPAVIKATSYIAAGVVLALFSGLLLTGFLMSPSNENETLPVGASATASAEPIEVEQPSALVAGPGPWLAWEETTLSRPGGPGNYDPRLGALRDAGHDTRNVKAWGRPNDYALAARPGTMSRSDKQGILDRYQPLDLFVIRPDFSVESHRIDKPYDIALITVGPTGILLQTRVDGSGLEQMAIAGRTTGRRNEDCCEVLADGTVTTDGSGGLARTIPFSGWKDRLERVGLERSDIAQKRRYWLWQEGDGWSEVDKPPSPWPTHQTVDGFYELDGNDRLHFSPDGREWSVITLGIESDSEWRFLEEQSGQLLLYNGDDIALVEPTGTRSTPFAGIPAPGTDPLTIVESYTRHEEHPRPVLLPDIGPVFVHEQSGTAVLGRDDDHWGVSSLPRRPQPQWPSLPSEGADIYDFDVIDGELVYAPWWSAKRYRAVVTDEPPSQPIQLPE